MSTPTGAREAVLLVHGLWMNGLSMFYLAHALRRAGFAAECFTFHSVRGTLAEHVSALSQRVAAMAAGAVHLAAHSLGGIVALHYLAGARDARLGRLVLLGAPVAGCRAARTLARWPGGRFMLGRSIDIWQTECPAPTDVAASAGAIAGSRPFGLGSVLMDIPGPGDGVVAVDETRLSGLADHLVLPVSHSGMLISRKVARQTAAFLSNGRFQR